MKQTTWRIGWYSKIVLTVIAVSLVGLLVRQLPEKVEAEPEWRTPGVTVLSTDYTSLRGVLGVRLKLEKEKPILSRPQRDLAQMVFDNPYAPDEQVLEYVLVFDYARGYRVKFMTDDFIILEAE